jgi:hypothetical protein
MMAVRRAEFGTAYIPSDRYEPGVTKPRLERTPASGANDRFVVRNEMNWRPMWSGPLKTSQPSVSE